MQHKYLIDVEARICVPKIPSSHRSLCHSTWVFWLCRRWKLVIVGFVYGLRLVIAGLARVITLVIGKCIHPAFRPVVVSVFGSQRAK